MPLQMFRIPNLLSQSDLSITAAKSKPCSFMPLPSILLDIFRQPFSKTSSFSFSLPFLSWPLGSTARQSEGGGAMDSRADAVDSERWQERFRRWPKQSGETW